MDFKRIRNNAESVKITVEEGGQVVGRVYLYLITNDLHENPYALIEDLFVESSFRNQGIGSRLVGEAIEVAKEMNCYKIIGTSRYTNKEVHRFYKRLNFDDYGIEFRKNL